MSEKVLILEPPSASPVADLQVPGSKSESQRVLVAASLARGTSLISRVAPGDDTQGLRAALARFGVVFEEDGHELRIRGMDGALAPATGTVDLGHAGTSWRFLLPLAAATPGTDVLLTGSPRLRERPQQPLLDALGRFGARLEAEGEPGRAPVRVQGRVLEPVPVTLDGGTSSQFLSGLLLAAPLWTKGLVVEVTGEFGSESYVEHTLQVVQAFGVGVHREGRRFEVPPGTRLEASNVAIEGDASSATYLWGLAALSGGRIRVGPFTPSSPQADLRILPVLESMGCRVQRTPSGVEVAGPPRLRAVEADLVDCPDSAPTLAVLAACASGESRFSGLATLRHKESDRGRVLAAELGRLGIASRFEAETLHVMGGSPRPVTVATHGDHRMALAFGMLGVVVPGIGIADPQVVTKSYPGYWNQLGVLGLGMTTSAG